MFLDEGGQEQPAQGEDGHARGAGEGGEEGAHHGRHHRHPARHPAEESLVDPDQPAGGVALGQDVPGGGEERDGGEGGGLGEVEDGGGDGGDGGAVAEEEHHGDARHGDEDRCPEEEGDEHEEEEEEGDRGSGGGEAEEEGEDDGEEGGAAQGPAAGTGSVGAPGEADGHEGEAGRHDELAPGLADAEGDLGESGPLGPHEPVGGDRQKGTGGGRDGLPEECGGAPRPPAWHHLQGGEGEVASGDGGEGGAQKAHPQGDVLCEHGGARRSWPQIRRESEEAAGRTIMARSRTESRPRSRTVPCGASSLASGALGGAEVTRKSIDPFRRGF